MIDKIQGTPPSALSPAASAANSGDASLRAAAEALEANFLAEMLKSTGLGNSGSEFGGGVGEEQFNSFLVQAQAKEIAASGGLGLAEHLFEALKVRANAE